MGAPVLSTRTPRGHLPGRSVSSDGIEIVTPRLVLREFAEADWRAVLDYQSDPRYLRYTSWEGRTEDEVRRFVGLFVAWQRERPRSKFQLAILRRDREQLVGNCGIRCPGPEAREAEMGYELSPAEWGQGFATEAARAMLTFAFDHLKLQRVWAECVSENVASARVLEKLGLKLEGRLREHLWMKGRWWDTLRYGILDDDWRTAPQVE